MSELDSGIDTEELRDAARRLLSDKVDRRAPWEDRDGGRAEIESAMSDLGWYLLTIPEELGGLGQNFDSLAPIYEEAGRALLPLWPAGTMAAIDVLAADGSQEALTALQAIAEEGHRIATVILPADASLQSARISMVPGADLATHLLLIPESGDACHLLAADAAGISIEVVETWDRSRSFADVVLSDMPADAVRIALPESLALARAHGELALAWDCVGAAEQCLTETVDYMMGREQFGRSIASFQALKHRAADHKVALELARSLAGHASAAYAQKSGGWAEIATQARLMAAGAFRSIAEDSVQLHGGVGFTWEYDCHLFLKRALVNEMLDGAPETLKDRIAEALLERAMSSRN
ncbi:MAG: acyl-CoA dehydrogenase family protein [Parasphingorhabdus sp.]|nr:acyl-CoA dehydrogenase family protein [Parasphingorhabdus sp.]